MVYDLDKTFHLSARFGERAFLAFGAPGVVRRAPSNTIEPRWGSFFNAEEQRRRERRERPHFRFSIEFEN